MQSLPQCFKNERDDPKYFLCECHKADFSMFSNLIPRSHVDSYKEQSIQNLNVCMTKKEREKRSGGRKARLLHVNIVERIINVSTQ